MKRHRAKPIVLRCQPKSDRLVQRLAMVLAWQKLAWNEQNERTNEARKLLGVLREVKP